MHNHRLAESCVGGPQGKQQTQKPMHGRHGWSGHDDRLRSLRSSTKGRRLKLSCCQAAIKLARGSNERWRLSRGKRLGRNVDDATAGGNVGGTETNRENDAGAYLNGGKVLKTMSMRRSRRSHGRKSMKGRAFEGANRGMLMIG